MAKNPGTIVDIKPFKSFFSIYAGILFLVILLFVCCSSEGVSHSEAPVASNGILDLTHWNFERDGPINLNGEWFFYWNTFLEPKALFGKDGQNGSTGFIKAPGPWTRQEIEGKTLPANGFATYRLIVLLPDRKNEQNSLLALNLLDVAPAYVIHVNGRRIASKGVLGKSHETMAPAFFSQIAEFIPQGNQLDIRIQVSNFHTQKSGLWDRVKLGTKEQIHGKRAKAIVLQLVLFGAVLVLGIYHLLLFFLRTKDRSLLYYALLCFFASMRIPIIGERYAANLIPQLNWELVLKLDYINIYMGLSVVMMFIYSLFPKESSRWITGIIVGLGLILSFIVSLSNALVYSHFVKPHQIMLVLVGLYIFYIIISALVHGREGAWFFSLGFFVFFCTGINDILVFQHVIFTGYILPYGMLILILSQALVLGFRSVNAFETVETQGDALREKNEELQMEVDERKRAEATLNRAYRELKNTQAQLIQSGKLAAIGELAAGVAHELNQPLMVARTHAQFVLRGLEKQALSSEEIRECMQPVEKCTRRMMNIINHLQTFSRQSQNEFSSVDINGVLKDCFLMIGEQLRVHNIHLKLQLGEHLPKVMGNAGQLEQVFLNVITNARDSVLEADENKMGVIEVVTKTCRTDNSWLEILVKDTGKGLDSKNLNRIFEPFFTTKDVGKGTGLGLSISHGIVKEHGGTIAVTHTGHEGTTFRILLPII
jgi:signal transduction histidine kinase